MNWIHREWPWYIAGPIIGLFVPALLIIGNKVFGISGSLIFGAGWALTGACPGPLVALIGNGVTVMFAALVSALLGTWVYGWVRPKLPH